MITGETAGFLWIWLLSKFCLEIGVEHRKGIFRFKSMQEEIEAAKAKLESDDDDDAVGAVRIRIGTGDE